MMRKGMFISFEGIEGSGKSTQVKLLDKALRERGLETLVTREPGGPAVSEAIRATLLNPEYSEMLPETELLLYMASRAQHTGQWILPALSQGKIVLCDRYNDSTIAYQGAARELDLGFIDLLAKFATFDTCPDLTFLFDLPVETGLKRISGRELDRLELESFSFHQKVREQYLILANKQPSRYIVLDAALEADELQRIVLASTLKFLGDL